MKKKFYSRQKKIQGFHPSIASVVHGGKFGLAPVQSKSSPAQSVRPSPAAGSPSQGAHGQVRHAYPTCALGPSCTQCKTHSHSHWREGTPQSSNHGCLSLVSLPSVVERVAPASLPSDYHFTGGMEYIPVRISDNGCIYRWLLKGNHTFRLDSIQAIVSSSSMVP